MSMTTVALSEGMYQRLHQLAAREGQSPEDVLDQALTDYERKLASEGERALAPRASIEAELLEDPGRIRAPSRGARTVNAQVHSVGRTLPRLRGEEE